MIILKEFVNGNSHKILSLVLGQDRLLNSRANSICENKLKINELYKQVTKNFQYIPTSKLVSLGTLVPNSRD